MLYYVLVWSVGIMHKYAYDSYYMFRVATMAYIKEDVYGTDLM